MIRGGVVVLIGVDNDDLFGSGSIGVIDIDIAFS